MKTRHSHSPASRLRPSRRTFAVHGIRNIYFGVLDREAEKKKCNED